MSKNTNVFVYALLLLAVMIVATQAHNCKELNQVNCYVGRNEGNFCNSKDHSKMETRWYYEKGVCKSFTYKGCNGNRNRFCTREACQQRCGGE